MAYTTGLIGPFKEYMIAYNNYCISHSATQIALRGQNGKRFKYEKPRQMQEIYPTIYEYMTNKLVSEIEKPNLAIKFAKMLATSDMPQHIRDKIVKDDK